MSIVFGIFSILIGITYAEVRNITNFNDLSQESISGFFTCMTELSASFETCMDMLDTQLDLSDSKYDGCKCLIPCISKIIGTMNAENGKWIEEKYWEYTEMLEPEWKADAIEIGKNCADRVNTHCSAGYPLFQCAMKHSKMLQNMVSNYTSQRRAESAAQNSTTSAEYEEE